MKIYRTLDSTFLNLEDNWYRLESFSLDNLFSSDAPRDRLFDLARREHSISPQESPLRGTILPPVGSQEIWGAGVTYFKSREARIEESESAKGGDFYDKVYYAERPELFFKANAHRVVGHRDQVAIRRDSSWNVPEAELTLAINQHGEIFGYAIGNDMSSRSIEGENPLYLPQAKVYERSCSIGPCLCVPESPPPPSTIISLCISRDGTVVFSGETTLSQMKRQLVELVEYLFRQNPFPNGAYLMTGTGIIPDSDFTLTSGDEISMTIDFIGTLENTVG